MLIEPLKELSPTDSNRHLSTPVLWDSFCVPAASLSAVSRTVLLTSHAAWTFVSGYFTSRCFLSSGVDVCLGNCGKSNLKFDLVSQQI